jgi:predicted DNA-binding WGR domain protein
MRRTVGDLVGRGREEGASALRTATPQVVAGLVALSETVAELERLLGAVLSDPLASTIGELRATCARILAASPQIPDWLPCLSAMAALPPELARVIRFLPLPLPCVEAALASKTLDEIWRRDRDLARFGGEALDGAARRMERHHARWLEANAGVVIERTRERFLEHVALSSLPSIRLGKEQDEFKRRYNAGRRELEHEFGKTMRYKSVRGLLAGPAGEVIIDLKPVWLMSPLSVSDTLPIDTNAFDVVIFDEASQVPLEEAIPALFRADQVVVSGDQMQLPPTNFFSATRRSEDNLLLEDDEEGETVEYELDGNSFLSHTARTLSSTMLGWHYRSRSESLISFSNAAFYEGGLLTVPERQLHSTEEGEIQAAEAAEGDGNAARLLARPVSFHHLPQGRYESRRNVAEARYIAHLVRGLLAAEKRPSIGIVAFSEAQQGAIEAALESLAATDTGFRGRLEEEYEREDDGQFAGLLVKNLENIQGDERDVIVLSVCYGHGPDGRMLMNFGPINQSGGEKRLNVAFSRARKHMAVVSSIHYSDVKNVYNDGANAMRNYLQYAEAMSAGDSRTAAAMLRAMNPGATQAPDSGAADLVALALAAALRERGLEADANVGHSRFRCPLAVRRTGETAHRVAVFIDDDVRARETDVLEREVLRPRLLRDFGWHVCTVLAKDWLEDPEAVVRRVEERLDGEPVVEDVWPDTEEPAAAPSPVEPPPRPGDAGSRPSSPASPAPSRPAALPLSALPPGRTRCFEFVAGSSSKFWHVTVDEAELVVVFGRIGTEGQPKRKAFPTPALARAEAERLIREKLAKGYLEVS